MGTDSQLEAEERAFLERLRRGDEEACRRLVREQGPRLYRTALRLLADEHEARDAVQDAFLQAFEALDRFEARARLSTWLYRILVNAALARLRRRRHREDSIDDLLPQFGEDGRLLEMPAPWTLQPEALAERSELRRIVRKAIESLPDKHREVLLLRDIEQLSTRETAEILGVTENAVKIRLHRARQALRTLLEPIFGEPKR